MKYAIISDIHGNFPALSAVIDDAKAQGVDEFWLIGDYVTDFPFPNEVTQLIKNLDRALVIRGNKEDYMQDIHRSKKADLSIQQIAAVACAYLGLEPENLEYLISLPKKIKGKTPLGTDFTLMHNSEIFFRKYDQRMHLFHSVDYAKEMDKSPFTHEEFLAASRKELLNRQDTLEDISKLSSGIYAFGHNHLQWHMEFEGKVFINPGACGIPLDFNAAAPYSILEETPQGFEVNERRVPYDYEMAIKALVSSDVFKHAEIWSRLIIYALRNSREATFPFLMYANSLAERAETEENRRQNPVTNEIWEEAARTFSDFDVYGIEI